MSQQRVAWYGIVYVVPDYICLLLMDVRYDRSQLPMVDVPEREPDAIRLAEIKRL